MVELATAISFGNDFSKECILSADNKLMSRSGAFGDLDPLDDDDDDDGLLSLLFSGGVGDDDDDDDPPLSSLRISSLFFSLHNASCSLRSSLSFCNLSAFSRMNDTSRLNRSFSCFCRCRSFSNVVTYSILTLMNLLFSSCG